MSDLQSLIEKLEQATEGSRELDAEIWTAVGLTRAEESHCRHWYGMDGRTDLTRDRFINAWAKNYTKSLDMALSLVPEGAWVRIQHARDYETDDKVCSAGFDISIMPYGMYARGATFPLALVTACLKWRAAQ